MRTFKFLLFTVLLIVFGYSSFTVAQDQKKCELTAKIEIESQQGSPDKSRATVKLEDGVAPIKYIFYEALSGRMVEKDHDKDNVEDLKKGSYICIIVDDRGCTKKIQFQIQ